MPRQLHFEDNGEAFVDTGSYFLVWDSRKWGKADIDLIADMRRKGVQDGELSGRQLELYVIACLKSGNYDALGVPADVV